MKQGGPGGAALFVLIRCSDKEQWCLLLDYLKEQA